MTGATYFDYLLVLPCRLAFMLFPLNIYIFFQLVSQHRNLKWWGALIPRTRFQEPLLPVQHSSQFSPSHALSGGYVLRHVRQVMETSDKVGCAARQQGEDRGELDKEKWEGWVVSVKISSTAGSENRTQ